VPQHPVYCLDMALTCQAYALWLTTLCKTKWPLLPWLVPAASVSRIYDGAAEHQCFFLRACRQSGQSLWKLWQATTPSQEWTQQHTATAAISLAILLGSLVMELPYIWERSVLHCAHDVATSQTELQTAHQLLHAQDALSRSVPLL